MYQLLTWFRLEGVEEVVEEVGEGREDEVGEEDEVGGEVIEEEVRRKLN